MYFSSGPCKKPYACNKHLGRAARSPMWVAKTYELLKTIHAVLDIPSDYKVTFVTGSATGAMETLLWNLLGPQPVCTIAFDVFGDCWKHDIEKELRLKTTNDLTHDTVFVHNGTTTGTMVEDLSFIPDDRIGLSICDVTSSVFCANIDWSKLDAAAFSFQKGLGSEAGIGGIVLSPRAIERLNQYQPPWAMPRVFRIKPKGQLNQSLFTGHLINTPSLMTLLDMEECLKWVVRQGGLPALVKRTHANFALLESWVRSNPKVSFYVPRTSDLVQTKVSTISPCLRIEGIQDYGPLCKYFEDQDIAYDIKGHSLIEPCIRIWCGPTVETSDLQSLIENLSQFDAKKSTLKI